MKKQLMVVCAVLAMSSTAFTQDFSATCREKMRDIKFFAGKWKGEAQVTQQGGVVVNVLQEETITFRIDSLLLEMEGVGRRKPDPSKISFHALGFVNYNAVKQAYEMKSFLMDGKQTEAFFKVVDKNKYDWGFEIPSGKIQYHITVDPVAKTWNEKGEFSPTGTTSWFPFFEMNLKKIN